MRFKYLLFAGTTLTLSTSQSLLGQETEREERIQKMIQEAKERKARDLERRKVTANHHYKTALNLYNRSLEDGVSEKPRIRDLRQARSELQNALASLPSYEEAQQLLTKINSALGIPNDRYEEVTRRASDERNAFYEQQVAEIENRYQKAIAKYNDKKFQESIADFESILDALEFLPYRFDFSTLRKQIEGHITKAKLSLSERQQTLNQLRREQAAQLARQDLINTRSIRGKRIEQLFSRAQIRYDGHEYDKAIKLLNELLVLDPENEQALLMLEDAEFNLNKEYKERVASGKLDGWEKTKIYGNEQYTLYDPSTPMQYPENYVSIVKQRKRDLFEAAAREEESWKEVLKATLQKPATEPYLNMAPAEIIQALQSIYEVTIIAPTDGSIDLDEPIDLPIHKMTFEQALNIFVDKLDPEGNTVWGLKNGAIYIDDKTKFSDDSALVHYDVRDLIGELKDFRGPEISLAGGEEGGGGITIEETSPENEEPITGDELKELIESTVAPGTWEDDGRSIQIRNGAIVVNHTPEVHEQIQELLSFMRKQRALQVTIQTRFLLVLDNDIDHIGVDWSGLDTAPFNNAGSMPLIDPENNGGVEFSGIPGSNLEDAGGTSPGSAGFVGPQGDSAFLRGNLIQSLGNGYQLLGGAPANILNSGGLLSWQFMNDFQVSALIKAVTLRQKGTILVAPTITSFNTQRANISVLEQRAYIRDLTAVVNVQIGLFDPDIGYIQSGTTLDVRPIVSHDRKYVTLELRPTVAELRDLRPIAVDAGGIAGAAFIEAPQLTLRAIRTTVSVPDGGTLLIGGYATGQEIDDYSGLPFLSKIPFVNFFAGASLRDRERANNYMLVKASIIDQSEIERNAFGRID